MASTRPPPPVAAHAPRRLAICIDDLGLHQGVNLAAQTLFQAGRVSSWSCLVDGPALPALALWLAQHPHDTLELGLHLNLTEDLPGAGWHQPLNTLLLAAYRGALDSPATRQALATEITRQFNRFEAVLGRPVDFVDGHQHVHQLPVVRSLLIEEMLRRTPGHAQRPWLRRCARPAALNQASALGWPEKFKPWLIERLGCARLGDLADAAGFTQNQRLLGVRRFAPHATTYVRQLNAWLSLAGADDVLMVHPACTLAGLDDPLIAARQVEFDSLASAAMAELLQGHGLRVARRSSHNGHSRSAA
jgi:chitin disaccharide deacetylase